MHKWKFSLKFCEFVRINALKQFDRLIRRQCMLRDLRHELYHQWSLPSWGSRGRCAPHVVFLLESMNCSQLGSSLGKLKMLPNGSGCRCHYIRHHLDWHWKGFHSSVFAGRAWREAPQLFSPVGKMLRQQNMQSSLILPGSPLIDLVILDSRDSPKALAGCKSKTRQGPEESVSTKTSKWKLFFPGNPGIPFSTTCRSCISKV